MSSLSNMALAGKLLQDLANFGVRECVVCAGARNAPIVKALQGAKGLRSFAFFEERSAAFFALGRAKKNHRPVAVITTSGTAAAELLPAMMEATYAGVPLVAVTADRPKSYRGSGAPQAVNQQELFGRHAGAFFDWDASEQPAIELFKNAPVHINIAFDEPLLDGQPTSVAAPGGTTAVETPASFWPDSDWSDPHSLKAFPGERPLVVVGALDPQDVQFVRGQLLRLGQPVYAESGSQLREDADLSHLLFRSGEFSLKTERLTQFFDSIVRVGSVPTIRLWRDLEQSLRPWPVASFSAAPYSGLSGRPAAYKLEHLEALPTPNAKQDLAWEREQAATFDKLLSELPLSEPGWFRRLSEVIPGGAQIFLGNSLPIREWDLAASKTASDWTVYVNRGVNGIDGLVSTFLGAADPQKENWLILGDLSALYDLPSLAMAHFASSLNLRVVVINNGGGLIFRRMFHDPAFENQHEIGFQNWAAMFGWNYTRSLQNIFGPTVIEIVPDTNQTELFWKYYDELRK